MFLASYKVISRVGVMSLRKDLIFLILQFLDEENLKETAHMCAFFLPTQLLCYRHRWLFSYPHLQHVPPHFSSFNTHQLIQILSVFYMCLIFCLTICMIVWSGRQVFSLTWITWRTLYLLGPGTRLKDIYLVSQKWKTTSSRSRSILKSERRSSLEALDKYVSIV